MSPLKVACTFVLVLLLALLAFACTSLLPRGTSVTASPWAEYADARAAFDKIEPMKTTTEELKVLGFDAMSGVNVTLLNYTDVITRFIPSPVIAREDLEDGILQCIEAKQACQVTQYDLKKMDRQRYGNFFLDFFNFSRKQESRGWSLSVLILLLDNRVIYKLWSGQPSILEYSHDRYPLGPFQNVGPSVIQQGVTGN